MIAFTVLGLPAHPLVVHAAVVGIPLASLGTIAYAVRPSARRALLWPLAATVAFAWAASIVAGSTGETLEHALHHSRFIEDHTRWAGRLGIAVHVLGASVLVALVADWWRARQDTVVPSALRALRAVALPVATLSAVACLALVAVVGHLGARAAWHDSPAASPAMQAER